MPERKGGLSSCKRATDARSRPRTKASAAQGPIGGTTIIFRQCVSHIFYKKKTIQYNQKATFLWHTSFCFFNKNFQLLIYSTNTFFMQHWGYQDDFKVNMSPENIWNMPEYLKRTKQQNYIHKKLWWYLYALVHIKMNWTYQQQFTMASWPVQYIRKLYSASSSSSSDGFTWFSTQL